MHGGKERQGAFCIARRNSTPALELQECVFHQVPQFVELFVIVPLFFPVLTRWYLRLHSLFDCLLHDSVAVVALICQ